MMTKLFGPLLLAAALTALGLAGGWYARAQTATAGTVEAPAAGESEEGQNVLSPQSLKNMGVTWAKAEKTEYVVAREVPAVVQELPASHRPVVGRWAGTVKRILPGRRDEKGNDPLAYAGLALKPGEVIVELLRAPLPMIDRALTGEIVQAVSETVHEAATELRSAKRTLDLAKLEWERIRDLNRGAADDLPVVPRQTEINLRYEMLKAKAEVERIESRLFLHGLTREQIRSVGEGAPVPPSSDLWKRALERNGLWPSNGEAVLRLLPEAMRAHPWTFAGLGELNALRRCDAELLRALETAEGLGARFHELVALIQQGHSLIDVVDLFRTGSLDPTIRVRAPKGAPLWEIREVNVRPGEKVDAGAQLALLANPDRVILELEAAGIDSGLVVTALENQSPLAAHPLVKGAGPSLIGIRLTAYRSKGEEGGEPRAYAIVKNEPAPIAVSGQPGTRRAWRLREGMRYMVRLPVRTIRGGFVLLKEAVVTEGPDRVAYIRSGDGFKRQPVHVLYEDFEAVVIADDGSIFPGDPVVRSGAFQLCLALRAAAAGPQEQRHGAT
ncbi:MAG: efflux RND transporter periplasmic adaptor subunit [Planctomycetota bacterium]|jgi:hypothetical protein